jgi:mannan endo-1,4-beta-mannosidase
LRLRVGVSRVSRRALSIALAGAIASAGWPVDPPVAAATPDVSNPPLITSIGPSGGNGGTSVLPVAYSGDGSHVVYSTRESLTPDDSNPDRLDLYDWSEADGVRLLSVGSTNHDTGYDQTLLSADGSHIFIWTDESLLPADTDTLPDVYERFEGQTILASTGPGDTTAAYQQPNATTADGSTLFFTSSGRLTTDDVDDQLDIYARTAGLTTLVSASGSVGNGPFHVFFNAISADGSHVFFQTEEQLDPADTDSIIDVYEWSSGSIRLVSTSDSELGPSDGSYAGSSRDGSRVYIISYGPLTADDTDVGEPDIFERSAGQTRLITTGGGALGAGNWVHYDAASDDGSHVVFEAAGRLSPDDTDNSQDIYDFTAGGAVLLSTGPVAVPPESSTDPQFLSMSADGGRVFFSTRESLVTTDVDSSTDLYLRSDGGTEVVSSAPGDPNYGLDAEFFGASTDGARVFFKSGEPLDAGDTNADYDVAIWEDGAVTRIPIPGSGRLLEFDGLSEDGVRLFLRTDAGLVPSDTDGFGRDIYQFRLPPLAPPSQFVTANGTGLELDGQPFTFTGMNIYNANSDGWCANDMDAGLLETALDDIDLGGVHGGDHGVIRAWFFQPLATDLDGTRNWARFDRTIAEAKARGYYVIPTLGNQWGECGHKGSLAGLSASTYKYPSWYETGYTQRQPEDAVYGPGYSGYRDWVAEVVDRYRDEPAILAWQLLNEAETNPVWPQGCPAGPEPFEAIRDWAIDVSGLVKSIDPNHLVSLGTIGGGQCGTSGPDFKALHEIPTIDLCEVHDYNPWDPMPGDQWNGLALRIQQCAELAKPLFVGEVGLRPIDVGGSYDSRVASLRAKLQVQRAAGIVGHLVWNWGPGPVALDSYDIGPGDDVPALLADGPDFDDPATSVDSDWIAPFIAFDAPTRSLYTLNEPVTASFSCTEVGSAGLATCDGTVPSGSPVDTSAPGRFTFTVTTTDALGNTRSVANTYDVTAGDLTTTVTANTTATVTTDPGGVGPSTDVPIQTTVEFTAPGGADTPVSIDLHPADADAPSGYEILGNEVDIDLGGLVRPADDPIVITFVIDSSTGADPATITVSRTNADLSTDVALPCLLEGIADGDPCFLADWVDGPGTDVIIRVYTTHASKWLAIGRSTPPVITPSIDGVLGSNAWYRSNVGIDWAVSDPQSPIDSMTGCEPENVTEDTTGASFTCQATSLGGTASATVAVKRDATPPAVTCQPADFLLGAGGALVTATVTDTTSGPEAVTVSTSADTSTVGRRSVGLTGRDMAGNATTVSCGYVVGYRLVNLKPAPGAVVKRGSTISVQFRLQTAAGITISDAAARGIASACAARILFSGGNASPGCARYDDKANTFLFDLKTSKTLAPGSYVVTVQVFAGTDVVTTASTTVDVRK